MDLSGSISVAKEFKSVGLNEKHIILTPMKLELLVGI
jgi:hypothetical protein